MLLILPIATWRWQTGSKIVQEKSTGSDRGIISGLLYYTLIISRVLFLLLQPHTYSQQHDFMFIASSTYAPSFFL